MTERAQSQPALSVRPHARLMLSGAVTVLDAHTAGVSALGDLLVVQLHEQVRADAAALPPGARRAMLVRPRTNADGRLSSASTLVRLESVHEAGVHEEAEAHFGAAGRLTAVNTEDAFFDLAVAPQEEELLVLRLTASLDLLEALPPVGGAVLAGGELRASGRLVVTRVVPVTLEPEGEATR